MEVLTYNYAENSIAPEKFESSVSWSRKVSQKAQQTQQDSNKSQSDEGFHDGHNLRCDTICQHWNAD